MKGGGLGRNIVLCLLENTGVFFHGSHSGHGYVAEEATESWMGGHTDRDTKLM